VAGGAVLRSLVEPETSESSLPGTSCSYQQSDVDLFLYGMTSDEAIAKVAAINEHLVLQVSKVIDRELSQSKPPPPWRPLKTLEQRNKYEKDFLDREKRRLQTEYKIRYARTKGSITFAFGPSLSVQVILRLYKSRPEVLMAFDLDVCAVGYDGGSVWALPRALRAVNGRFNMIDETRPNVKYEARLFKYAMRGFAVGVPGMKVDRSNVDHNTYASHASDLAGLGVCVYACVCVCLCVIAAPSALSSLHTLPSLTSVHSHTLSNFVWQAGCCERR